MVGSQLHRFYEGLGCGLDTEGESLNLAFARPWQVGWAVFDPKRIIRSKWAYIWWDDLHVSKRAAEITHFDYAEYKAQARPAAEVLEEFDADLYNPNHIILWQNGLGYDAYTLRNWRRACGKPTDWSYLPRTIDLNALTKALKKGWKPNIETPSDFLAWQYAAHDWVEKGLKTNLELCGKEEKIDHDYANLHKADVDVDLMIKVYRKRLWQVEF